MANPAPDDPSVTILDFNVNLTAPVGSHWAQIDAVQERHDHFWTSYAHGHWVLTDPDHIREAFQTPELFSSISEVAADPDPSYTWIPTNVDPPEHVKYRQVLNAWFSPGSVAALGDEIERYCAAMVDGLADRGGCDFVADFATVYPTTVFLHSLGLPVDDTRRLAGWVRDIFDNLRHPDLADTLAAAMGSVRSYFADTLADRRRAGRDPERDFVTHLVRSGIDGRPLGDDEILNMCVVLMMAGVETTSGQLGFMFHDLARHPARRRRLIDEPAVIPAAVEEYLRVHPIVMPGRKLTRDIDFHGCPMREGDMVMLPLPAANRSPLVCANPREVDYDRRPNRHIAFGTGPHRCLGLHLARRELATALAVWHARIPDYRLDSDEVLMERGGTLSMVSLPLRWDVTPPPLGERGRVNL